MNVDDTLKELLVAASGVPAEELDGSVRLDELGLSSLQLQILAGRVEKTFGIQFDDGQLAEIRTFDQLREAVSLHLRSHGA